MKFVSHRDRIEDDVTRAFHQAMEDTVGEADSLAPTDEGTLRASLTWDMIRKTRDGMKARFGSALRYAAIRELGGTILPVRAPRLAWRDKASGKWRFAKRVVQQPGGRVGSAKHGKRYLQPAGERFGDFMTRALRRNRL